MTSLSKLQRMALLAASTTVITGGVLLPTSAFAAAAPAGVVTTTVADAAGSTDAAAQWTQTTDAASGVTVQLPGEAQTETIDDDGIEARVYDVTTDYGFIRFTVFEGSNDSPEWDLAGSLQEQLDMHNQDAAQSSGATLSSEDVQEGTTAEGLPALDAALTATDGTAGSTRLVDLGQYMVQVVVLGTTDDQQAVEADFLQVLNGLELSASNAATRSL
ncbi:hypothetical protein ACIHCM_24810 [Streptomyces sp. NPDC052023]|uniref:hypothetical protein n=1 Tax=Streptomyces sp. NPDC052023 TaxID=3365681 RepID=UPI0037CD7AD8